MSGIKFLDDRAVEPIAAALSVGCKGVKGQPIDKDRFYIVNPAARSGTYQKSGGGTYTAPVRDAHPLFSTFNVPIPEGDAIPKWRTSIPIVLAHMTQAQAFSGGLFAKELPGFPKRPNHAPSCVGDGEKATRWLGEKEGLKEIRCGNEKCEFWKKPCKPTLTLFARFNFPRDASGKGLPNLAFKYRSSSIYTYLNFAGLFRSFRVACAGLGVEPDTVPLFGLPLVMNLQERTSAGDGGKRFPVVSLTVSDDRDMLGWVISQMQRRDEVRRLADATPLPMLTDRKVLDATIIEDSDLTDGPAMGIPNRS